MPIVLICILLLISVLGVGCNLTSPELATEDMSMDFGLDQKDAPGDSAEHDARHLDARLDARLDESQADAPSDAPGDSPSDAQDEVMDETPLPACASIVSQGWRACKESGTRCELVFDDSRGCAQACAILGRSCVQSYEDTSDKCTPNTDLPLLGCAPTDHRSDYCICDVPRELDASLDMPTD